MEEQANCRTLACFLSHACFACFTSHFADLALSGAHDMILTASSLDNTSYTYTTGQEKCQIGLDGIHVLDPATSRTLRIYSLDAVTRWEVLDSYIFSFWAKTSVDVEPKRIRLKSNSYTTNTIFDTVTAASIQFKEMGDRKESDYPRASKQQVEIKKSFVDWMNFIKPPNEEKNYWGGSQLLQVKIMKNAALEGYPLSMVCSR